MSKALWWKCHDNSCGYIGKLEEFSQGVNGRACPRCRNDNHSFPHRLFKCQACGTIGDQDYWFPESGLDENPLDFQMPALPCEECAERWEKKHRKALREAGGAELEKLCEELKSLTHRSAQVIETPVQEEPAIRKWKAIGKINFSADREFHGKKRSVKVEAATLADAISQLKLETVLKLKCSREYVAFVEILSLTSSGPQRQKGMVSRKRVNLSRRGAP